MYTKSECERRVNVRGMRRGEEKTMAAPATYRWREKDGGRAPRGRDEMFRMGMCEKERTEKAVTIVANHRRRDITRVKAA